MAEPTDPRTLAAEAETLAQRFHEAYERLAPQYSYETRPESAKPWADVPADNRALMTAVCAEILAALDLDGIRTQALRDAADQLDANGTCDCPSRDANLTREPGDRMHAGGCSWWPNPQAAAAVRRLAADAPSARQDRAGSDGQAEVVPDTLGLDDTAERAREAKRRLFAALIASAHLLDQPFTNAPDLSPWSRSVKPAMSRLDAASTALLADLDRVTRERNEAQWHQERCHAHHVALDAEHVACEGEYGDLRSKLAATEADLDAALEAWARLLPLPADEWSDTASAAATEPPEATPDPDEWSDDRIRAWLTAHGLTAIAGPGAVLAAATRERDTARRWAKDSQQLYLDLLDRQKKLIGELREARVQRDDARAERHEAHTLMVRARADRDRLADDGQPPPCCDTHGRNCEPPGDLCCHGCTEAAHDTFPIRHADGSPCSAPDLSGNGDANG